MTLNEILQKYDGLEVSKRRSVSSDYVELVFLTKETDKVKRGELILPLA